MTAPTVLALGGGGFTSPEGDPPLDDLVLDLCAAAVPRILFLPTAGGDEPLQIARFQATFGDRACETDVLSLFRLARERRPLRDIVLGNDAIYAGGGSLRNLVAVWRAHGIDALLREAWRRGTLLAGVSAGAMCWFRGGVTTSGGAPATAPGLGLLPGSLSVHADGELARRPVYLEAVRTGALPPGWLVDDGAALIVRGAQPPRAVTARPGAGVAYADGRGVLELAAQPLRRVGACALAPASADVRELRALRIDRDGETELKPRRLTEPDRFGPAPEIAEFRAVRALRP